MSAQLDRHLPFDVVFNFRDLGGYPAHAGGTVKWRTVFRADGVHRLSVHDLAPLGVRTVVDLRTPQELERGRFTHDSIGYHHLPILEETWSRETLSIDTDAAAFLCERYVEMLTTGRDAIARVLHLVARPDALPLVFHCAAGKDRTGVVAAVLLSLLGVDGDDIAADYSLSRLGMPRFREWIIATHPEAADAMSQQPEAFLAAPTEAMHQFLERVQDEYGSFESYVIGLGVDHATIDAVNKKPPHVTSEADMDGHGLLTGKSVLVTAAAGTGIGFATAKRCVEEGATVFISDAHARRLSESASELGVASLVCDVTDQAQVDALLDAAGDIDVLVNNAGLGGTANVVDMTDDQWAKVLDVTLTGTFRCTRAALQHMQPRGRGVIVNNASVLGWRAQAGQAHYAAAKAGVMALTRCAAIEAAPFGVRINAVAPSIAMHPFLAKTTTAELLEDLTSREAFGRAAEPWEVANVIVFLASDYSSYMTGEVVSVSSQHP